MANQSKSVKECLACGADADSSVSFIFPNRPGAICGECVGQFNSVLEEVQKTKNQIKPITPPDKMDPMDIYTELSAYVVGQKSAKEALSISISNHLKRLRDSRIVSKSNLIILGPTGTGKTQMAKVASKFIGLPCVIMDTSSFTPAGFIGGSVSQIALQLLSQVGYNLQLAQRGIVFLDEIDKLVARDEHVRGFKASVQAELLKMIDGTQIEVKISHPDGEAAVSFFDTTNLLFIGSGAFTDLPGVISKRVGKTPSLGLHAAVIGKQQEVVMDNDNITDEDLIQLGLIPELVGRFSRIAVTSSLSQVEIEKILVDTKDSILSQFTALLAADNVSVKFDKEFTAQVAKDTYRRGLGVRGAQKLVERHLHPVLFEASNKYKNKSISIGLDGLVTVTEPHGRLKIVPGGKQRRGTEAS